MLQPLRILEVGAFTGYASICMAVGLPEGGMLHAIEVNDELASMYRYHIIKASVEDKVRLHVGDAAEVIPTLDETFDLIFLDAGKLDYLRHFELASPKLRPGGILLADNVLWDGKVVRQPEDATARVLRDFNERLYTDPAYETLILPLRDGLLMARKREASDGSQ